MLLLGLLGCLLGSMLRHGLGHWLRLCLRLRGLLQLLLLLGLLLLLHLHLPSATSANSLTLTLNLLLLLEVKLVLVVLVLLLEQPLLMMLVLQLRLLWLWRRVVWHHLRRLLLRNDIVLNEPLGIWVLAEVHSPLVKEAVERRCRWELKGTHGHGLLRVHLLLDIELDSRLEVVLRGHVHGCDVLRVHCERVRSQVDLLIVFGEDEHVEFIRGEV